MMSAHLSRLRRRTGALLRRSAMEHELDDELRSHLEMEIEYLMQKGMSSEDARREAMREFGSVDAVKDAARDARGIGRLEDIARDARVAVRSLLRSPAFTAVALLTLALGIGATTAVFSVVDGVLLRPLPYPQPERLVQIHERNRRGGKNDLPGANAIDIQQRARTLARASFYGGGTSTILGLGDGPVRADVYAVSPEFFEVLGVRPVRGRAFVAGEGRSEGEAPVVVSDRFWRQMLGSDPDLGRRSLSVYRTTLRVVGVMPPGFAFPANADLWVASWDDNPSRTAHNWSMIGRLAPGATPETARRDIESIFAPLKAQLGDDMDAEGAHVTPLHEELTGESRTELLVLLGAVLFVLLVACVNIASANLARGETRQRELAVRAALGAGRGRLVRQLLTENVLLAAAGGALGVLLAILLTRVLVAVGPGAIPGFAEVKVDGRVLLFALAASLVTGLAIGLAPALLSTTNLRSAISQGHQEAGGRGKGMRGLLVGAEVALALALLVGAGLLVRSLKTLLDVSPGFRTERVMMANVSLPSSIYSDTLRIAGFFDQLLPQIRAIGGVDGAGMINQVPLGGGGMGSGFMVDGGEEIAGGAGYRIVDSTYFRVLDIPLLRGRSFGAGDRPGAPHVTVINQTMATRYWPGQDPMGKRLRLPGMDQHKEEWLTIVGIVGDVRHDGLDEPPRPEMYIHYAQRPERLTSGATVVVRGSTPAETLAQLVRAQVRAIDRNVPVETRLLRTLVDDSVAGRRFSTMLLGGFAGLALFLAAIGIYGVLSYSVARRQREIGVRMALGARHGTVRAMILRDSMRAVVPGVAVGLVAAFALSRLLRGMLFGVTETDPLTFAVVPIVLTAVALVASWVPALRATRVDPMVAIRNE